MKAQKLTHLMTKCLPSLVVAILISQAVITTTSHAAPAPKPGGAADGTSCTSLDPYYCPDVDVRFEPQGHREE